MIKKHSHIIQILYLFIISRLIFLIFGPLQSIYYTHSPSLCLWDCPWYSGIISNGYQLIPSGHGDGDAANWAYLPVFPKTIAIVSDLLSVPHLHLSVAFILNNIAFFFGLYFLFLYVKKEYDEKIAMTSVLLMTFSPYSIYFSIPYTESFFFLFMILVFFFANNGKWIYAAIMGALLSGTKIMGVMIVFPMLFMAINQFGLKNLISFKNDYSYRILLSILIAPLGLFIYMLFLHNKIGDALAFKHVQIAWGREIQNPLYVLYNGLREFWTYKFYMALASIFGLTISFFMLYKKKYAEFIFLIISIIIPLSTSLASIARYILTLFPVYIALSLILNNNLLLKKFIFVISIIGLVFMSISWVNSKYYMI